MEYCGLKSIYLSTYCATKIEGYKTNLPGGNDNLQHIDEIKFVRVIDFKWIYKPVKHFKRASYSLN